MTVDVSDLEKLIKKCPNISLSNKDIKEIIESKSYNGVKSKYSKKNKPQELPVEAASELLKEELKIVQPPNEPVASMEGHFPKENNEVEDDGWVEDCGCENGVCEPKEPHFN